MGIKTKFNPMGGISDKDKGKLSLWRYSNAVISGKTLLYNYTGSWDIDTLYVPKCKGNSIINDWVNASVSGTTDSNRNTPFHNNPSVLNVDLQGVLFRNNSMYAAFYNSFNLTSVQNISNSVTNMVYTFYYCNNLNQNIQIPNSVTDMSYTFYFCYNLNQNIQIPNSVTSMAFTFSDCNNLNQNIQIPNSVTSMSYTFSSCSNFNQNIQIPNSVTDMSHTFQYCYNLNQNIQILNSVTDMNSTFRSCNNLNQNIKIPNSVTAMYGTFNYCDNMCNSWINIYSTNITNASFVFNGITNALTNRRGYFANVFIIADYPNGVHTRTYNSLKSAGWTWSDSNIVGTLPNAVGSWSLGYSNYSSITLNGTHYILGKWHGEMDTYLNSGVAVNNVQVPEYLSIGGESLKDYPVAINRACFKTNVVINSIDFGTDIPWSDNVMGSGTNTKNRNAAFMQCSRLNNAKGVINTNTTGVVAVFDDCYYLKECDVIFPEAPTSYYVAFEGTNCTDYPPMGSGATNCQSMFWSANSVVNSPVFPANVTVLTSLFNEGGQTHLKGNIFMLGGGISTITNAFRGPNTSLRKNIYIPFTYSNGVNTVTYNSFKANNLYKGTSGNGSGVNPMYNSTSNFYVYNLSAAFGTIWSSYSGTTSTSLLKYNDAINTPHMAVFAQYPNYNVTSIGNNCFNGSRNLISLALYNKPWNSTSLDNAFNGCSNLRVIQGLNLTGITNLSSTFSGCSNLRVMRNIPATVTNMAYTFYSCSNFNFNVQILGNSVTDMYGTFSYCSNLNQNIQIPNSVTNMSGTFDSCNNLNQNIQIPNSVTDMYGTFSYCYNLNQNIQIPNSVTNMSGTFSTCLNLQGRIDVLTTELVNSYRTFYYANASKPKDVYIYYNYANGTPTKTYNLVVAGTGGTDQVWDGKNGVTVHNLGSAPW